MKFVTFKTPDGRIAPGVLRDDLATIVDLGAHFADMLAVIDGGDAALATVRELVGAASAATVALADVQLQAPLPNPRRIRDCSVFEEHMQGGVNFMRKMGIDPNAKIPDIWYQKPIYYKGNHLAISGPDADLVRPPYGEKLDYELEIAMVTGKRGKTIAKAQAWEHIFGFTIFNDFSVRNTAMGEIQGGLGMSKSKDFDGANVLGPWLVTKDEIADVYNLKMSAMLNGEPMGRGSSNTSGMTHRWDAIIAYASEGETLYPGEVIGSGTVGGGTLVEMGRFLADGDVVELAIEGLGTLRNRVVGTGAND
ncbi:MAG TPA: fumarylacetoacetate hydrolase family protein [Burkholderiaceae bacterium]|nr:fumarylacetoacetate hydrolase family protein [Burkholderiaceae bacterium]